MPEPESAPESIEEAPKRRSALRRGALIGLSALLVFAAVFVAYTIYLHANFEPSGIDGLAKRQGLVLEGDRYAHQASALKMEAGKLAFNPESVEGKRIDPEKINIALIGDNSFACADQDWSINPIALKVTEKLEGSSRFRVVSFAAPRMPLSDAADIIASGALPREIDAVVVAVGVETFLRLSGDARLYDPADIEKPGIFDTFASFAPRQFEAPATPVEDADVEELPNTLTDEITRIQEAAKLAEVGVLIVLVPNLAFVPGEEAKIFGMEKDLRDKAFSYLRVSVQALGSMPNMRKNGIYTRDLSDRPYLPREFYPPNSAEIEKAKAKSKLLGITIEPKGKPKARTRLAWEPGETSIEPYFGARLSTGLQEELGHSIGKALAATKPWLFSARQKTLSSKGK